MTSKISEYKIIHRGTIVGTNEVKRSWKAVRSRVDTIKHTLSSLIAAAKVKPGTEIALAVEYRTRHDVDGMDMMIKFFVDQLVKREVIPDDRPKYWKFKSTTYNPKLRKGTIVFNLLVQE